MDKVLFHYSARVIEGDMDRAVVDGFWSMTDLNLDKEVMLLHNSILTNVIAEGANVSPKGKVIITSLTKM